MTDAVVQDVSFCHLVVGVTDMDRALAFYRDVLGMDVVFETLISGEPFDAVLHAKRQARGPRGRRPARRIDGRVAVARAPNPPRISRRGEASPVSRTCRCRSSILNDTHRRIRDAGYPPDQDPFEIGGVRMFFVKDPDGTPVEFIELPDGVRSTYEMHRGVRLQMGPVE